MIPRGDIQGVEDCRPRHSHVEPARTQLTVSPTIPVFESNATIGMLVASIVTVKGERVATIPLRRST
jgi:hypothetical protein